MKEVYILVTNWASDFNSSSEVKAYSTREKAKAAYDIEVKTEKFTDSMCEGCFDGEGNFIEDNDEGICCDEFAVADGESFSVYREGFYEKDHFTVYYKKINLDAQIEVTDFQKYLQQMAQQEQEALDAARASGASQEVVDAIERRKNSFEQQLKEDMNMSNITVYESNTKGKEAFTREVLTPVVQQYGYSVASYTGEDGKDEKVWLFKRSNRKIGFIDDAQFAVDVTADSVTALFEDVLRRIGVIPDMRELLDKTSLIKACLNYIQSTTETCEEFANVMLHDLGMTKDEIEEYGKDYCLDVLEEQD